MELQTHLLLQTRNLLKAGYEVVVWNRTADKCDPLVAEGAKVGKYAASSTSNVNDQHAVEQVPLGHATCTTPSNCTFVCSTHSWPRHQQRWRSAATSPSRCWQTQQLRWTWLLVLMASSRVSSCHAPQQRLTVLSAGSEQLQCQTEPALWACTASCANLS